MKVGQFYIATCVSSDPAEPLDPNLLVASSDNAAVTVEKAAVGTFKVSGASPGSANVTYSQPGFKPAVEAVTVTDLPQIVVTDGPVQG